MVSKTGKKIFKKKTLRKFKKRISRKIKIPTAPAQHTMLKLTYYEELSLTPVAGYASYIYRINDLYDPNLTGVGHQPLYRDQMFLLYSYARVLGAKITVQFTPNTGIPVTAILAPIQSGTADTVYQTAMERKGAKSTTLNGYQSSKTLSCYSSSDFYFGQKKGYTMLSSSFEQTPNSGLASANSMWYQILLHDLSTGANLVYVRVKLEMFARFEQPIQQSSS